MITLTRQYTEELINDFQRHFHVHFKTPQSINCNDGHVILPSLNQNTPNVRFLGTPFDVNELYCTFNIIGHLTYENGRHLILEALYDIRTIDHGSSNVYRIGIPHTPELLMTITRKDDYIDDQTRLNNTPTYPTDLFPDEELIPVHTKPSLNDYTKL